MASRMLVNLSMGHLDVGHERTLRAERTACRVSLPTSDLYTPKPTEGIL